MLLVHRTYISIIALSAQTFKKVWSESISCSLLTPLPCKVFAFFMLMKILCIIKCLHLLCAVHGQWAGIQTQLIHTGSHCPWHHLKTSNCFRNAWYLITLSLFQKTNLSLFQRLQSFVFSALNSGIFSRAPVPREILYRYIY